MFKITLDSPGLSKPIDMPKDKKLGLFEACYRADIYKKRNPQATFTVVDMETGDFMYQI